MSLEPDIEFVSKDTCTCEQCGHVNITKIRNISSREKKGHMVYSDRPTWVKIRTAASSHDMTIGEFLAFVIKFYEAHRESFNVPQL